MHQINLQKEGLQGSLETLLAEEMRGRKKKTLIFSLLLQSKKRIITFRPHLPTWCGCGDLGPTTFTKSRNGVNTCYVINDNSTGPIIDVIYVMLVRILIVL